MRAIDLLKLFLTHPQGMAIVVDEFGGTEGIITMADIVEDILSDAAPVGDADLYIEPLEGWKIFGEWKRALGRLSASGLASSWTRKESTPSRDWFSIGWVISHRLARISISQGCPSLSVEPAANESGNYSWKKRLLRMSMKQPADHR